MRQSYSLKVMARNDLNPNATEFIPRQAPVIATKASKKKKGKPENKQPIPFQPEQKVLTEKEIKDNAAEAE